MGIELIFFMSKSLTISVPVYSPLASSDIEAVPEV